MPIGKKREACSDLKKSKDLGYNKAGDVLNKIRCD